MSQVLEQRLEKHAPAEAVHATEIARHVRQAISQTRRLARGFCPVTIESEGLVPALEELAADAARMFHVRCRFECPKPLRLTHTATATHLFRIAQEAVSNAIRHGRATRIRIRLTARGEQAELSVSDNGLGLPKKPKKTGMGLRIMHYRAGMIGATLRLESGPGQGTTLRCAFKKKL
jgi:signal transduction histidine kinase